MKTEENEKTSLNCLFPSFWNIYFDQDIKIINRFRM